MDPKVNDVAQISPDSDHAECFLGVFLHVTEVHPWGVQGFVPVLSIKDQPAGQAFLRVKHEEYHPIGKAWWVPEGDTPSPD